MIIEISPTEGNTYLAYTDDNEFAGTAVITYSYQPKILPEQPHVFTIQLTIQNTEAIPVLLGAGYSAAHRLAAEKKGGHCIRLAVEPENSEACSEMAKQLGFTRNSAILHMTAPLGYVDYTSELPRGMQIVHDRLSEAQERTFYLDRINDVFGTKHDAAWLEELLAKPGFARHLLVDENGAVGEFVSYLEDNCAVIAHLWVHPEKRRQHFAYELVLSAIDSWLRLGAKRVGVDVWTHNVPAYKMFKKLSFIPEKVLMDCPYAQELQQKEEN